MPDLKKKNTEDLCKYHIILLERLDELPERASEIKERLQEIHTELERRAYNEEFVRPNQGLLSFYGYHVGSTDGKREGFRRKILIKIFKEEKLPLVGSFEYIDEWGEPESIKRLNKINNSLWGFLNSNYPAYMNMTRPFKEWHADLKWIKKSLIPKK